MLAELIAPCIPEEVEMLVESIPAKLRIPDELKIPIGFCEKLDGNPLDRMPLV